MGLFKEINCVHCGKKTGVLTRRKLEDGNYVCSKCMSMIPNYIATCLGEYNYEQYQDLRSYLEESENTLSKLFRENHSFYAIHIDTEHELFYIDIDYPRVYLKFEDVADFRLEYEADEVKEGLLGDKVTGKIYLKLKMYSPYFYKEAVLASNVKASANVRDGLFQKKVKYSNPKGMDDFLHYFLSTWRSASDAKYARLAEELNRYNAEFERAAAEETYQANTGEVADRLQQAMALFMIDDLSKVTLSEVKTQRNRLIKTFHPDMGVEADTHYAQKINEAYELLELFLSE